GSTAGRAVAGPVLALGGGEGGRRGDTLAAAGAGSGVGAGVAVVTRRPAGGCRVRAHATRRVARAGDVALIERRAGDGGGRASAGAVLARLPARAGVVVVARRPVRLVGVGAGAVAVAGAGLVALVGCR